MFIVSSCICLCPTHWSQVVSREWNAYAVGVAPKGDSPTISQSQWSTILFPIKSRLILEVWISVWDGAVCMIHILIVLFYGRREYVDTVCWFFFVLFCFENVQWRHLQGQIGDFASCYLRNLLSSYSFSARLTVVYHGYDERLVFLWYMCTTLSFSASSNLSISKAFNNGSVWAFTCCRLCSEWSVFGTSSVGYMHIPMLIARNLRLSRPCWSTLSSWHTRLENSLIYLIYLHILTFCSIPYLCGTSKTSFHLW